MAVVGVEIILFIHYSEKSNNNSKNNNYNYYDNKSIDKHYSKDNAKSLHEKDEKLGGKIFF